MLYAVYVGVEILIFIMVLLNGIHVYAERKVVQDLYVINVLVEHLFGLNPKTLKIDKVTFGYITQAEA